MKRILPLLLLLFTLNIFGQTPNINEFHYDNTGTDVGEFVEVFFPNPQPSDLTLWTLYLYNGSNGQTYGTATNLASLTATSGSGGVFYVLTLPANGLQNGDPDGIALVGPSFTEFISYDGSFTATNGPLNGQTSSDVGVAETSTSPVGGSVSWNDVTMEWVLVTNDTPGEYNFSALPVKLGKFEVFLKEKNVVLKWNTLSEVNNSHFIVSHSIDGKRFKEISKTQGSGNSSAEIHYEYIHENPANGVNYYQLTQVDFDGRSETFEVKWVKVKNGNSIKIYPFHVNNDLFIDGVKDETIEIYNALGSLVYSQKADNRIDMSGFPSGIYLVKVNEIAQKIFKQ